MTTPLTTRALAVHRGVSVRVASLPLFCAPMIRDGRMHEGAAVQEIATRPIEGLRITRQGSGRPDRRHGPVRYHAITGLYGLTDLPAGALRLHIEDPQRRFVSRTWVEEALVEDAAFARAIREGSIPTQPARERSAPARVQATEPRRVTMRWAIGAIPLVRGLTVIVGYVRWADGSPMCWARVQVEGEDGTYTTHTDPQGNFLIALSHEISRILAEIPDPDDEEDAEDDGIDLLDDDDDDDDDAPAMEPTVIPRTVRIWRPRRRPAPRADPLLVYPDTFDELTLDPDPATATPAELDAFDEHYVRPHHDIDVDTVVGEIVRAPMVTLPLIP